MANLFVGSNRGQTEKDIVKGSSTNSTDIEVRIDDTKGWKRSEIVQKLRELANKIQTDTAIQFG